jgi:CRP-like cAMP-binding protein
MRGHIRQIAPSQLERLRGNPKMVAGLIRGKARRNSSKAKSALERAQKIAAEARAAGILNDPAEQERVRAQILKELAGAGIMLQGGPTEEGLNLEKSWHVLHYLLTGKPEEAPPPLGDAILGGTEIGDDLGYGPARFLTAQQVREVAKALAAVSNEDLASHFDLDAMIAARIYPVRDGTELEMAQHYFEHLTRYYADASTNGNAMLLYLV